MPFQTDADRQAIQALCNEYFTPRALTTGVRLFPIEGAGDRPYTVAKNDTVKLVVTFYEDFPSFCIAEHPECPVCIEILDLARRIIEGDDETDTSVNMGDEFELQFQPCTDRDRQQFPGLEDAKNLMEDPLSPTEDLSGESAIGSSTTDSGNGNTQVFAKGSTSKLFLSDDENDANKEEDNDKHYDEDEEEDDNGISNDSNKGGLSSQ